MKKIYKNLNLLKKIKPAIGFIKNVIYFSHIMTVVLITLENFYQIYPSI